MRAPGFTFLARRPAAPGSARWTDALAARLPLDTDIRVPLRPVLLFAALLIIFITFSPLTDLASPDHWVATEGRETWTYLSLFAIAGGILLVLPEGAWQALRGLLRPANLLLVGWLFVSVATSEAPVTSLKRLLLGLTVLGIAAAAPLLVRDLRQLARLLVVAAAIAVALSYAAVIFTPELAIHQKFDIAEPNLAGDWRGIYAHKNLTAMAMALFTLIGLFAMRAGAPILGGAVLIGAAGFLLMSGGKNATAQVMLALLLGALIPRIRTGWLRWVLAFGPLLAINVLSVGSVMSEAVRSLLALLPVDQTFTGRTDVWRYVVESIAAKPVFGYGFQAFWGMGREVVADPASEWAGGAASSHNAYLDFALTTGLPGLALLIVAMLVMPFRDFGRALAAGAEPRALGFFLSVWLLTVYVGSFEAFYFDRADPVWFSAALSVCGLAYLSRFRVRSSR